MHTHPKTKERNPCDIELTNMPDL